MTRTDIGLALNGAISWVKYTLTYADLTATATTQNINLLQNPPSPGAVTITPSVNFVIPQGGKMIGVCIHHTTAFSGGSLTSMTVSIGKSGNNTFFSSAFDIFQTVGDTVLLEGDMFKSGGMNAVPVTVTFTGSHNVNTATAGSVDVYLCLLNVSTSSGPGTLPGQAGLTSGSGV